jgi:hypothetical protein
MYILNFLQQRVILISMLKHKQLATKEPLNFGFNMSRMLTLLHSANQLKHHMPMLQRLVMQSKLLNSVISSVIHQDYLAWLIQRQLMLLFPLLKLLLKKLHQKYLQMQINFLIFRFLLMEQLLLGILPSTMIKFCSTSLARTFHRRKWFRLLLQY